MSPLEPSNFTTVDPLNHNTAEAQDKDLKMAFVTVTEVLKEEMNKSLKGIYENTNNKMK